MFKLTIVHPVLGVTAYFTHTVVMSLMAALIETESEVFHVYIIFIFSLQRLTSTHMFTSTELSFQS